MKTTVEALKKILEQSIIDGIQRNISIKEDDVEGCPYITFLCTNDIMERVSINVPSTVFEEEGENNRGNTQP